MADASAAWRPDASPPALPKNRCASPFQEAKFEVRSGLGIDPLTEMLDLGLARGLVEKSSHTMPFAGSPLGDGRERSRKALGRARNYGSTLKAAIIASGPVRPGRRSDAKA